MTRLGHRLVQLGLLVAVVWIWHWASTSGRVHHLLLPSPSAVYREFSTLLINGGFLFDLQVTIFEVVVAFLLAAIPGCFIGYLVGRSAYATRVFDPIFTALYAVPMILLFPLYLLFFGLGSGSKIAVGTTFAFFPIVLNTIAGLSRVERGYIRAAKSMGASESHMFFSVMLPAAFPVILGGLRIGSILAFLSVLGAETISSYAGIGYRIASLAESMDSAKMFAFILFASMIAIVLNFGLSYLQRRFGEVPA